MHTTPKRQSILPLGVQKSKCAAIGKACYLETFPNDVSTPSLSPLPPKTSFVCRSDRQNASPLFRLGRTRFLSEEVGANMQTKAIRFSMTTGNRWMRRKTLKGETAKASSDEEKEKSTAFQIKAGVSPSSFTGCVTLHISKMTSFTIVCQSFQWLILLSEWTCKILNCKM